MKNRLWKRWLFRFCAISVTAFAFIGSVNFVMDPLWVFGINGWWNAHKFGFDERQQKTNYLPQVIDEIDAIVIGSSMSRLIGSDGFQNLKTYNYACSSLYPHHAAEFISHAIKMKKMKIFIGIDMWNLIRNIGADRLREPQYYIENASSKLNYLLALSPLSWGIKSLISSVFNHIDYDYLLSENLPRAVDGTDPDFESLDAVSIVNNHIRKFSEYDVSTLRILRDKMLDIDVVPIVFITPVTKFYLKEMIKIGAYPTYERFIRDSVFLFGSVWNFMYMNSATSKEGYFYDPNHTNSRGGRAIAQRISGGTDFPPDFGTLVTRDNLDEHLEFLRKNILENLSQDVK